MAKNTVSVEIKRIPIDVEIKDLGYVEVVDLAVKLDIITGFLGAWRAASGIKFSSAILLKRRMERALQFGNQLFHARLVLFLFAAFGQAF